MNKAPAGKAGTPSKAKKAASVSERAVIATLLCEWPAESPENLRRLLEHAPLSFDDLRLGNLAVALREISQSGGVVHPAAVIEHLDSRGRLESAGGSAFIASLASGPLPLELATREADTVWNRYHPRRLAQAMDDATKGLASSPDKSDTIMRVLQHTLQSLQTEEAAQTAEARSLASLQRRTESDAAEILKAGYLCRGGGLLLCGPTGIGKSSLSMQCMILWALGREAFGIQPARPLKSLLVQAENDDGDLAEMRDGVVAGLALTETDAQSATARALVIREDERTGTRFFTEVVGPLLSKHRPDLLWIDPALAYLGGEANSQKDVGAFLRNWLNPLLHCHNCGCVIVHHTNKPPKGTEKPDWRAGDFAYLGAGSAEWANWARAILALRSVGSHDVFELRAAKRGARLNWVEEDGHTRSYVRHIAHAQEPGVICWRAADAEEIPAGVGRRIQFQVADIVGQLNGDKLSTAEWLAKCKEELGISKTHFYRLKAEAVQTKKAHQSPVDRAWLKV